METWDFREIRKLKIKEFLCNINETEFNHDIKLAPAWVRKILITKQ